MELTHSASANKTIEEWAQAVANDRQFSPGKEFLMKNPARSSLSPEQCETQLGREKKRVERAVKVLNGQKLIDKDSVVLDLGCGTGTFALPLAKIVKHLDAVDISAQMTAFLREKMEKEKVMNIRIIQKDWLDFTRENNGERYDLVLSSLNPNMYNGQAILEMTKLSKRACLFSSPYKRTEDSIVRDLDDLILGTATKPEIDCRAIIYPFNILYYLGYNPKLEYVEGDWTTREAPEEAIKRLTMRYEGFMEVTGEIKNKIKDFVYARQKGGIFEQYTLWHIGLLIWKVNAQS